MSFRKTIVAFAAGAMLSQSASPVTVLDIAVENVVGYQGDVQEYPRLAMDPKRTTPMRATNFSSFIMIGDITSVNGRPAKGLWTLTGRGVTTKTVPAPGEAVADVDRANISDMRIEILHPDGTSIGTIMTAGLGGGAPPPGAPSTVPQANIAVVGGTGAFFGVRGQGGNVTAVRPASMTEDPANRRSNGGGTARLVLHLIPMTLPEISATASGPAVFHADFSPVTPVRPARAGEVLIVRAAGLGPTRPGVNPGQPFSLDTAHEVNSPIEVTVNGRAAEVVNKVGWPGEVDNYRVDFRIPEGISRVRAAIQLSAAWISSAEVNIDVQ